MHKIRSLSLSLLKKGIFVVGTCFFVLAGTPVFGASLRWIQLDRGVVSHVYRAGSIMVQKDKITAINQTYGTSMFDGTKWTDAGNPNPRGDNAGDMFLDSRGIIYVGGKNTADNLSYIFESTDGLNFTPVQQFVDAGGSGYVWNFTEDKYGNVWAGEYTDHLATTGAHLWRRRPNGVWTNVANWPAETHIHQVYYDPFRDSLYVAVGDLDHGILKLPSNKINADGISASDFSFILPNDGQGNGVEVTAMTSDANYIYAAEDLHTSVTNKSRALIRITDNGTTQSLEYVFPLTQCAVWNWAHVDDNGVIVFFANGTTEFTCTSGQFFNKILASDDHGTTWQVVKDYGTTVSNITGANGSVGLPSYYTTNWSGLYGTGSGFGAVPLRGTIGRVVPTGSTFYVDGTNGVDWTNFGVTQSRPIKSLTYLELLDVQPGDTVNFIGNNTYTSPLIAGWSGNNTSKIILRGNTTSTLSGGNLASSPAVSENFESATTSWNFTLYTTGGSITQDNSIVHEGSYSAKVVRGASGTVYLAAKNVPATNINEGDTMYTSYWFYYPTDQTSSSDQNMFRILDNSNYEMRIQLVPSSSSRYQNEVVLNAPQTSNWAIPSGKSVTSGVWHKMYIEDYLDSTKGSLKMYIDNQLWMNVSGIKTVTAGGKLNALYFYAYQNPITFYIDDFKFGKFPFDNRGAFNTNDYSYLDLGNFKFGGNNGALVSSSSTNIDLHDSIFNGLTNDAIISAGGSSLNYYYNSIFGSGRYGINATTSATLKNNIIYNSITNDVFVGAGATLTGSNNWFKDSNKSGGGAYLDGGNTVWSGASPGFVNSGTGDFRLLSTSPLIDIGAAIVGFVSDFIKTLRPQGTASDIGAYEYIPLTVTINQAVGQDDPVSSSTVNYTVIFSEVVSDFTTGDVTLSGTAGATTATVTGSGKTYNIAVTGMNSSGTVIATIAPGVATGASNNTNASSTSVDNTVTVDTTPPTAFTVSSPSAGANTASSPTFTWNASSDASSGLAKYQFYLDGSLTADNLATTSLQTSASNLSCGNHTWYVRAFDNAGNTTDSGTQTFAVSCGGGVPSMFGVVNIQPTGSPRIGTTSPSTVATTTGVTIRVATTIAGLEASISALLSQVAFLRAESGKLKSISIRTTYTRTLRKGFHGKDVTLLQEFLKKDPVIYPEGLVTGYFGTLTENAVRRFQEKYGIVSSGTTETTGYGVVGPKTRTKINRLD
ncbi:MAG: choice-of-anchor Q domain-containing protein [Minisyncoccota bacterium]